MPAPSSVAAKPECIRLRGVRQNNLKGFDLDVPLGRYIAVTGLSGAGKSSLVFDTLHAEGQRRYVETFSAYTRQFLDLLDKPKVDSIENIRPSIAIEQTNTVKTSRSTVGTMTELTDFFKVWFSHVAECFDPTTGEKVEDDNPQSIWEKTSAAHADRTLLVCFKITKPANLTWPEIFTSLKNQGYLRLLVENQIQKIEDLLTSSVSVLSTLHPQLSTSSAIYVVQDRLAVTAANKSRFLEATETALHFGQSQVFYFASDTFTPAGHFSRGLHSPSTGRTFRAASPALFSFNSPLGACPKCRGFGRVIDIDYRLTVPDQSRSLDEGAIKCWESDIYGESKKDLYVFARQKKIPTNVPFASLSPEHQAFIIDGEPGYGEDNGKPWPKYWYGVKGFFRWLEKSTYKMHVRVFLARYRAYNPCPACDGQRLQPEALCWKWQGRTLPVLYQLPISELLSLLGQGSLGLSPSSGSSHSADLAFDSIRTRLRYLAQVGLAYLTLDRQSKTLSGGEVQRVNLTSCLGTSLIDTLFVLDEPSVGLHPRDIDRLIAIIRTLTDAGNTVVVVEHDEAMIRAADHVIEVGPEPGSRGGHIIFEGPVSALLASPTSITGAYFSGRETIPVPTTRRPVESAPRGDATPPSRSPRSLATTWLHFKNATKHNLRNLDVHLPLGRLVCLSGVSGSGKSTLLDHVIYQGLLAQRLQLTEDPAVIEAITLTSSQRSTLSSQPATAAGAFSEILLVDQSPLSRTPRSNPALYTEAWELIRDLYAATPAALAAGFSPSSFSFNSGDGRCDHCQGLGYERVEMQFLSDVFVPCPVCESRRFKPEVLAIRWCDRSIADLLATSVTDALPLFADHTAIHTRLSSLESVGLGYLTLGQPLNTLSGGESQRLKLVRYLGSYTANAHSADSHSAASADSDSQLSALSSPLAPAARALLLLDEPTTGLHRHDVKRLLAVLQALVDRGHSVVVIEHNLDVLKSADWLLEIGPDAGANGGRIVAEGIPEHIARTPTPTAPFLREALANNHLLNDKQINHNWSVGNSCHLLDDNSAAFSAAAEDPALYLTSSGAPLSALNSALSTPGSTHASSLRIEGARENNLKNISLSIAHRQLTVVTGVSGSGKSTLAFDIVFAEGQRRFMESMSPYARQFVEQLPRPAVDRLTGIPPTVAIEQRITRGSRKSTVATITEVAQYLRLLYARLGTQHHPDTDKPVTPLSPGQLRALLTRVLATPAARSAKHLYLCAPLIRGRKGHHQPIATWIANQGYELMRADGRLTRVDSFQKLDRYKEHDIEVVVADLKAEHPAPRAKSKTKAQKSGSQLAASVSPPSSLGAQLTTALHIGKGSCFLLTPKGEVLSWFSTTRTDIETGESFPELDPKNFSFNSPRGWCPTCRGHGRVFPWMLEPADDQDAKDDPAARLREFGIDSADDLSDSGSACPECHGTRLNRIGRSVKLHFRPDPKPQTRAPKSQTQHPNPNTPPRPLALSLPALLAATPAQLLTSLRSLELDARGKLITQDIVPQIEERLKFLDHVGLGYLSLDRPTDTLSGGESQRIRLAAQLGTNLAGVLYVLDEPSIGLHARDNDRLIETLQTLRAKGNTLLVVEHDEDLMARADRIIDLGPAAGIHGGELLAHGTPAEIRASAHSLTGLFLAKGIVHPLRGAYRPLSASSRSPSNLKSKVSAPDLAPTPLTLSGVSFRNLKNFDLHLPPGRLIMVAGPSGAGKSTLFRDVLQPAVAHAIKTKNPKLTGRDFVKATGFATEGSPTPFTTLTGASAFRSVIEVDQSPIGKTPRSTPATYLGIFDLIRQFFAALPESKIRGYAAGRFSFNTAGGRCPTCDGAGRIKLEMAFMPDTYLPCDDCRGSRYSLDLNDITWKGKTIGQVLQLTFEEAAQFFDFHSQLSQVCRLMVDCGLGYLTLGQSSPTLSGGEAQRLKLVTELAAGLATYRERSRGTSPRNLYLLEEPTIGLHLSDCEKLIGVLHSLVDQGHTVVVIEHHLDLLAEADYIIELGPVGGPDGGELLYQGELAGLLTMKRSPTAPYLRAKLK
ncbi:MAG: excinuclease ABC subunit A [Opitutia bacterium]|nr:MAG: excinuclease ABC subunit A [Opitutae bacterium]